VLQVKGQLLFFLWHTRRFSLCSDRTLRRYDGQQLRHSAAITSTTSVSKVGDTEFTVTFLQPDLRYHMRAASSEERDAWASALAKAIANGPVISFFDRYLGRGMFVPANHFGQAMLPSQLVSAALCTRSRRPLQFLRSPARRHISPLQLQRFLRSCVLATAHALASPPASVCRLMHARTRSRWIDCIFVRVMSGFVARAEVRRQAARCACACRVALAR
jgi:hypothetical protein